MASPEMSVAPAVVERCSVSPPIVIVASTWTVDTPAVDWLMITVQVPLLPVVPARGPALPPAGTTPAAKQVPPVILAMPLATEMLTGELPAGEKEPPPVEP